LRQPLPVNRLIVSQRDPRNSVRAAALAGVPELIERLGGDAGALLRAHGFDRQALANVERHVPYADFIRLLEDCAAKLDCPDFGLRVAALQDINVLGPVATVIRHSSSVADAVVSVARYLSYHTPGAAVELVGGPGEAPGFTIEVVLPGLRRCRQINELSMLLGQRLLDLLLGEGYRALAVHFTNAAPPDAAALHRALGSSIEFDMPINRFVLRAPELLRPVESADPALRRLITGYIELTRQDAIVPLVERVNRSIRTLLPSGCCTLVTVAEHLGCAPRSLQRSLSEQGVCFRDLLQLQQEQAARRLLATTGLPLLRIANMTGFSEQSTFNRAFSRWTRQSPGRWRRKLQR
jgi:AraC-like DNA-binding protein